MTWATIHPRPPSSPSFILLLPPFSKSLSSAAPRLAWFHPLFPQITHAKFPSFLHLLLPLVGHFDSPSGSSSVASPSLHKHTQTHKIRDKTRGRSNGSECNEETVKNKPDRTEQNQTEPSSLWQMVILWAGFVQMWECVWVFITLVMVSFSSRYKKIRSLPISQSLPLIYDSAPAANHLQIKHI